MHTLVLQHAPDEGPGLIGDALAAQGIGMRVVRVFAGEAVPDNLGDARALVVLGGPMGVYEADRYSHLRGEMQLIERALEADVLLMGVCLGSQLLAHVLGANVQAGARKEIGWLPVTLTPDGCDDALLADARSGFVPLHWHGDVFDLPAGCTALAYSAQTPLQAFRYDGGTAPVYGFLFHLEATPEIVAGMVDGFAEEARAAGAVPEVLREQTPERLARLRPLADAVWTAWAIRVAKL